jgi:hypothetical protein
MDGEEQQHLLKQLRTHRKNLRYLEDQRAQYGIDVPIDLKNKIEHEQAEIATIKLAIRSTICTRTCGEASRVDMCHFLA